MAYDPSSIIYKLIDPRDCSIWYIGTTISSPVPEMAAQGRLEEHLRCTDTNLEKATWIRELRAIGMQPILQIIEEINWRIAEQREAYWIKHHIDMGEPLVNIRIARKYRKQTKQHRG